MSLAIRSIVLGGIIASILSLLSPSLYGQKDSSIYELTPVTIEASSLRGQDISSLNTHWGEEELKRLSYASVSDVLERESGVFIKSYGNGSLATSSIRGAGAGHTAVIWNGLPVSSPMLGQLDLSLLPVSFVDELEVQFGGNTSIWGSGAIGGTILLNNHFDLKPTLKLEFQHYLGSFGQKNFQTGVQFANNNFGMRTRFFYQEAQNDFEYFVAEDLPLKQQTHGFFRKEGLLQEFFWKPSENQQISLHGWLQNTYREIPPTSVQRRSEAFQEDQFMRISLNYQRSHKKGIIKGRAGLFNEKLDFHNPLIGLDSESQFLTALGEVEFQTTLREKHQIVTGIHLSHTRAISDGYAKPPTQNNIAVFATDRFRWKKWKSQLSFRQEVFDGKLVSPVVSFAVERALTDWLDLNGKIAKNYRFPTLNDRFWDPGGNPELKPESGWSEEIGLNIHPTKQKETLNYSLTVFNRNINDWILWSVRPGDSFWSANNLAKVWSRGIEQRFNAEILFEEFRFQLQAGYDYTLSTNQIASQKPNIEAGSQLIYVPKHQLYGGISTSWKSFEMSYQHRYIGSVHTVNLIDLPAYQLGYFRLDYQWEAPFITGDFSFHIDNLWNTSYKVIERRPMPGRSFRLGVRFLFDARI